MSVPSTDSIKASNPVTLGEASFHAPKPVSQTLDQVFQQDRLKESRPAAAIAPAETAKSSWWEYVLSFIWKKPEANKGAALPCLETAIKAPPLEPLSPIPAIEKPEGTSFTWTPSMKMKEADQEISLPWIQEGLSLASPSTIEEIVFIILHNQLELEKEIADMAEKTYKNQEKAMMLKDKILDDVRDALARDEKVAGYFAKAQYLTIAAGLLATIAIAVAIAPTFAGVIGAGGAAVKYGATALGALDGFKTALKAYFDRGANQNKASFAQANHARTIHKFSLDDILQDLMNRGEITNSVRELIAKEIKKIDRMIRFILQK